MSTPLLLSAPKRIMRDAARATKGKAGLMIEQVTAGTLSSLLGLPGMVVTEYACEQQGETRFLCAKVTSTLSWSCLTWNVIV